MEDKRRKAIKLALESFDETSGPRYQVTITGAVHQVPVITIDPELPLLNHDNYRIKSQLEDDARASAVLADPTSDESQKVISSLIAGTREFGALKSQLETYGQQEPGLISASGMLVNGNTRAVALRKLRRPGMKVAVLPELANQRDLLLIQSDLQMRKWVHQDYSFTNELFFLSEMKNHLKLDLKQLVQTLGMKPGKASENKISTKFRLLKLINEIRKISESRPIPYSFFDEKQTILEDLDKAYELEKTKDLRQAERLKYLKIQAMIRGLTKDQVRIISVKDLPPDNLEDDGDDIIPSGGEDRAGLEKTIVEHFTEDGHTKLPDSDEEKEAAIKQKTDAENEINRQRLEGIIQAPQDRLDDAVNKLGLVTAALEESFVVSEFDLEKFEATLGTLKEAYDKLSAKVQKIKQDVDDGD